MSIDPVVAGLIRHKLQIDAFTEECIRCDQAAAKQPSNAECRLITEAQISDADVLKEYRNVERTRKDGESMALAVGNFCKAKAANIRVLLAKITEVQASQ